VTVPPIVIGGNSDAAARRAGEFGDEWFVLAAPADLPRYQAAAAEQAAHFGRPAPTITTSLMVAIDGDPDLPTGDTLTSLLTDPDGMFGIPPNQAAGAVVTGSPDDIAKELARLADAGAHRTIIQFVAGSWPRQATLVAEARALLA
jgi:alkanesulfonate monooxygenase SsuD/methylene tetrahydromethanopterin reductase-like flavin-dependent oxidoreductase (luciferase family)